MASVSFIPATKLVELIQKADAGVGMFIRVISSNQLAVGKDPMQPTLAIDLSKEKVTAFDARGAVSHEPIEPPPSDAPRPTRSTRRSGDYWFELLGKRSESGSLHALLGDALQALESARPGTLEKLSQIKPRSKRIVARDKRSLFATEAQADEFGDRLVNGWWYGTNNSAQETNTWLKRACECAGLNWQRDLKTNLH